MNKTENLVSRAGLLALTIGAGLLCQPVAHAQDQTAMAPPVSAGTGAQQGQNVYNWQDVPVNQQVQITRAVFDQGGYQLYASTGETIVVPFVNQNLYAMKFGQTSSGMYFVNDGTAPTLFVPPGGYLENAAASGAHWYPFPQHFNYTAPVYIGIAPSWSEYTSMGWYPGMAYYGGYWGYHPWHVGLAFSPFPGLFVSIGGHPYYGWGGYHSYYYAHPYNRVYIRSYAPYHYYGVARRGPAYFSSHRNVFVHNTYNRTTVVHNSFGHSSFGHPTGSFGRSSVAGRPFGGGAVHSTGSFGHSAGGFGRPASTFGHTTGSFGHSPSGFGASRPAGGSFGHSSAGSFGHSAPSGGFGHSSGGSFGHSALSGGSHGSFGGGGGSHGSFGGGGSHGGHH